MAPTIKKIAELAGVSIGTVDRALHDRGRVNPEVAQRIKGLAEELGYKPNSIAKGLKTRSLGLKIAVILHLQTANPFFDEILSGISRCREEIADFGISVTIFNCPDFQADAQLALIDQVIEEGYNGILIVPIGSKAIEKRLMDLDAGGFPVVLLTNIPEHLGKLSFVGCNYTLAGELAAGLAHIAHPTAGKVVIFSPSLQMYGHKLRRDGICQKLQSEYPHLTVSECIELTGDDIRDYLLTTKALASMSPDVLICPAAYSKGHIRAVGEYAVQHHTTVLCFDYSQDVYPLLQDHTVTALITQDPQSQGYTALHRLFNRLTGEEEAVPGSCFYITTKVYFKENISEIRYI